jgi:hypothetical protein
MAPAPGITEATPADTTAQRGYLITIHCRTPNKDGLALVSGKLLSGLTQKQVETTTRLSSGTLPKPQYIFQKVWIPRYFQLKDDKARVQQLRARARETAERRKAAGAAFGAGSVGVPLPAPPRGFGMSMQPVPQPYTPPAPARPPGMEIGAPSPDGTPAEPDPVDPLTDESIMSDWDVIVVVAVVLDPAAPAPAATEQPQGPPARPGQRPHAQAPVPNEPLASR